jgi:hypothetical protein
MTRFSRRDHTPYNRLQGTPNADCPALKLPESTPTLTDPQFAFETEADFVSYGLEYAVSDAQRRVAPRTRRAAPESVKDAYAARPETLRGSAPIDGAARAGGGPARSAGRLR